MGRLAALRGLVRSTPVRLALGMALLFSLVSLATLGFAYLQIRASIADGLRTNLDQHVAGFRVAADPLTLTRLVAAEASGVDPEDRILVFLGPAGTGAGNAHAELRDGKLTLSKRPGGEPLSEDGYISKTVPLAGGLLIVAESLAPLRELRETFLALLGFSLAPTFVLSLGAAVLIARSSARRVARIEATLDRLAKGDLAARVNADGRDDDLARIGAGIDRMAAAQQASVAALRQVSADIAHDLKTPVQRISVLLSDLRNRIPEESPEAAIAEKAAEEAERAAAVFQSLLQIAQIEGGGSKSRFGPVDLGELVETFAEIYEPAAEDSGHVLTVRTLPPGAAVVVGDKGLLGQVLANLIENALRHTPPGAEVRLSLSREDGRVALTVADTGPGIPREERGKVTRRLYRLERSRTTPGNGLGLSLVAAIADLHGAELSLEDNAPGLRVRIVFPPDASGRA